MTPEEMVSRLLYRDGLMLVIDKPAGMAVHAGPPNSRNQNESVEDHFDALRFGLPRPPALAHRLDRDTTGCLILGRHRKALAQLGKLFRSGAIDKLYWAVVEGAPATDEGVIEFPLGRLDDTIGWWMKHDPQGQPAVTKWKVLGTTATRAFSVASPLEGEADARSAAGGGSFSDPSASHYPPPQPSPSRGEGVSRASAPAALTWVSLEPLTGRTHQLRVHCAEMGWPILGDSIYGNAPRHGGLTQHLHAREVTVPLYKNRPPIRVTAPVPAHMREALTACGWKEEEEQNLAAE
jgi:tRNA pseudouridine32 synthase / 23S rRNA pseudouridine746 synthase